MQALRRPLPAVRRTWLDVPFEDRNVVKRRGALWDPVAGRWYAPVPGLAALQPWRRLKPEILGEDRGYGHGLYADPIPSSSWYRNVRSAVSHRDWYRISKMTRRRAGWKCEGCGWPPPREDRDMLEAHERFAYDESTGVQRLVRLICLCSACHGVTHFGLAVLDGDGEVMMGHLQLITGMDRRQARAHLDEAMALCASRSRIAWQLDLSLIEALGVAVTPEQPAAPPPGNARSPATSQRPAPGSRCERWLTTGER